MFNYSTKLYFTRFTIDAFCLLVCYLASVMIVSQRPLFPLDVYDVFFPCLLIMFWNITAKATRLYSVYKGKIFPELKKTIYNILFQVTITGLLYLVVDTPAYFQSIFISYLMLITIVLVLQKVFVNGLNNPKKGATSKTNVLIIGSGKLGMNFYKYVNSNPGYGYKVVGVLDDKPSPGLNGHYLGKINQLENIFASDNDINEVVVALPNKAVRSVKNIISITNNQAVRVRVMPDYSQFVSPGFTVESFGGMVMVNPRPEPLEAFHWRFFKRAFDIVFSLVVLVFLCSWLFPIVALVIKLSSKGPVFFKQLRSGKNKVPFYCYKFRSMFLNDDAHLKCATKNDPRVTMIGKILRKTNIDEMPQFWNVLIGDMAVVGPRPHMVSQNGMYSKIVSKYALRQLVKPGVTGWAQVSGFRGEIRTTLDMQNRIERDVWYLEHWSFWMDIKIIFLTLRNMIKGEANAC